MSQATPETTRATPSPRRIKLVVLAIALGCLPFVLAEVSLRAFGIGSGDVDVHDGFGTSRLFVLDERGETWRTNLARERFFFPQEFPADKSEREFRIFVLGGSTVQGRPFEPATSFAAWMSAELNEIDSSRDYRAINCGGISYASYRLVAVAEEIREYQPDLVVLATGHNEFLEDQTYSSLKRRSRIRMLVEDIAESSRLITTLRNVTGGSAPVEPQDDKPSVDVEARLDSDAGYAQYHRNEQWRDDVTRSYRRSVDDIIELCESSNTPLVAVRLGSNLRDCPPFKSEHRSDLSVEDEQRWRRFFDQASAVDLDDPRAAISLYEQAAEIDDRHALLHFRIARCFDRIGDTANAEAAYRRALEEDVCPLRMISDVADALIEVCEQKGIPLVDAETVIANNSPDGIPGFESYIDHVHPSIAAHQQIAEAIVGKLIAIKLVEPRTQLDVFERRRLRSEIIHELPSQYASNGRRRIGWLENWARRQRLQQEILPADERGFTSLALRRIDLGDFGAASDDILMALTMDERAEPRLLGYAADLFTQGRTTDAAWLIEQIDAPKARPAIRNSMALARLILATARQDFVAAAKRFDSRTDWDAVLAGDQFGWKDAMPNVFEVVRSGSKATDSQE